MRIKQRQRNKAIRVILEGTFIVLSPRAACMDIRQYWKPQEEVVPTKKGLCLRSQEVVPCYVQSDHMNQLGALQCSECNPNDYETGN